VSTQITVTVGSRALIERAQQEQAANRAEHLEKERREQLAAKIAKEKAAQAKDKDQDGVEDEPIPGLERRPAAFSRSGGLSCARVDLGLYSDPEYKDIAYFSIADAERTQVAVQEYGATSLPTQAFFGLGGIMLPVARTTGILVYPVQFAGTPELRAVVVAPKRSRRLTPPAGLLQKVRHLQADLAYVENKWVLARQFGIHPSNLSAGSSQFSHRFTPAIYTLLGGSLDGLTTTTLTDYASMRRSYFSVAPRTYLRNDYENQISTLIRHKTTNAEPPNTNYVIPASVLRPDPSFDVRVNREGVDSSAGRPSWPSGGAVSPINPITTVIHYLAWDWGNPGYCRQQLLALGFKPSDLAP
jgi:hypothetical protein